MLLTPPPLSQTVTPSRPPVTNCHTFPDPPSSVTYFMNGHLPLQGVSVEVITNMLILFFVYRNENVKTHGAWDYSLEGRGRLQVPKDRSWTLNSYSFNTPPEQADIRSPRTDPLSKFRYMRSMV